MIDYLKLSTKKKKAGEEKRRRRSRQLKKENKLLKSELASYKKNHFSLSHFQIYDLMVVSEFTMSGNSVTLVLGKKQLKIYLSLGESIVLPFTEIKRTSLVMEKTVDPKPNIFMYQVITSEGVFDFQITNKNKAMMTYKLIQTLIQDDKKNDSLENGGEEEKGVEEDQILMVLKSLLPDDAFRSRETIDLSLTLSEIEKSREVSFHSDPDLDEENELMEEFFGSINGEKTTFKFYTLYLLINDTKLKYEAITGVDRFEEGVDDKQMRIVFEVEIDENLKQKWSITDKVDKFETELLGKISTD